MKQREQDIAFSSPPRSIWKAAMILLESALILTFAMARNRSVRWMRSVG
jgi:hypothetical protein